MKIKDDSFFKMVRDYLTIYLPKQLCSRPNTLKSYKTALNQFVDFLTQEQCISIVKLTFEDFTAKNVNAYLDWLQEKRHCSSSTRNQRLMALRSFANYCKISDIANVYLKIAIDDVVIQKVPGKVVDFLTEDAMKTLLALPDMKNHWGLRNGFFMLLMYDTAARCQEMLDIKIGDLILDHGTPYIYLIGKGEKPRSVPLMEKTVEHLRRYLNFFHPIDSRCNDDFLFYTVIHKQRHQMSPDTVARFVKNYGREARKENPHVPLKVHPHQFRHTRAIHLYRSGIPLPLVGEYLGHANTSTTKIYAYADTEMKSEALKKATSKNTAISDVLAVWEGDDNIIKRLYCLK